MLSFPSLIFFSDRNTHNKFILILIFNKKSVYNFDLINLKADSSLAKQIERLCSGTDTRILSSFSE